MTNATPILQAIRGCAERARSLHPQNTLRRLETFVAALSGSVVRVHGDRELSDLVFALLNDAPAPQDPAPAES